MRDRSFRTVLKAVVGAAALAAAAGALPVPAFAQSVGMQDLINRVDRLQRELTTLQRQVYTGKPPPADAATSAPPPVASDPGDSGSAARNAVRISQLENEIRRLTGRIEEVDHHIGQIQRRLDQLVGDMDRRLTALEGGRPAAAASADGAQPGVQPGPLAGDPAPQPQGAAPPLPPNAPGAPPRPLGTIPRDLAVQTPRGPDPAAQPQAAQPVLPPGTPEQQYDYALSLMLQKQDFAQAETALRAFLEAHPKDKLAGNAQFWLGETFFVRKNFQDAAFAYAESFQKYPKGIKAPDSLLKLGMSLAELDKKKEACTAYSRLLETFPRVNATFKARVDREQRRSKCK